MSLNVKWADFTRRKTVTVPVASAAELAEIVELPLPPIFPVSKGIRLLGLTLSSLDTVEHGDAPQLALAL